MGLSTYRRKRDFARTPEPRGGKATRRRTRGFVVHEHHARALHYDLRLEHRGVLLCWAVPKGPPLVPGERRLAVRTEDHPLEYAAFEGRIPEGQYGAGEVGIWDRGTWEPEIAEGRSVEAALEKGELTFSLAGERLSGRWVLVRLAKGAGRKDRDWLLIKRSDPEQPAVKPARSQAAARKPTARKPASRKPASRKSAARKSTSRESTSRESTSRKSVSRKATKLEPAGREPAARKREPGAARAASDRALDPAGVPGAVRAPFPRRLAPQLCKLAERPPEGTGWVHEIKLDGYRFIVLVKDGRARLLTRRGEDWSARFAHVARELAALGVEAAVDGEVVVLDEHGVSDFQRLQNSLTEGGAAPVLFAFDLPYLAGFDLSGARLVDRKRLLERLLAQGGGGAARYHEHAETEGALFLREACRLGLEGIVSKRADARYRAGQRVGWIKTKCLRRLEFVIGGWSEPSGSRRHFGALLVGYHEDGRLRYAGKVGAGFTDASLRELSGRFARLARRTPPFVDPPSGAEARRAHWVAPRCVAEIEFTEWTSDGKLRHPVFHGLREDKQPSEVTRETEGLPREASGRENGRRNPGEGSRVAGVTLTHPERVLIPDPGVTKLELARYYEAAAERLLPQLAGRPLTLVRCPEGTAAPCFYQKHRTADLPEAVDAIAVTEKRGSGTYVGVHTTAGLVELVQRGTIELHPWGARADRLERPDRIVIDLDPGPGVPWERVVRAAHELREILEALDLVGFARTTGGKGLHVVLPIARRSTWDEAKGFALELSAALARRDPKAFVLVASKAKRRGRIFVDYLRNARGATAVASYSVRARPGAPVATPLAWDELVPSLDPARFHVRSVHERWSAPDPWAGFDDRRQALTSRLRARLASL